MPMKGRSRIDLRCSCSRAFHDWHVDCEYNREGHDPKTLAFSAEVASPDDTEGNTVYPDIIVHHRGEQDNLLVVEAKKMGNHRGDDHDFRKLIAFRRQLKYRYAVFLRLGTDRVTLILNSAIDACAC